MQTTSPPDGKEKELLKLENTSSTKVDWLNKFSNIKSCISYFIDKKLRPSTAESIGWVGIVLLHSALIPTYLAIMSGLSDKMPPVDLVLFIWGAMITFFIRAAILKDTVNILTIGAGFIVNSVFLALILFK
jgi:hypothetical protein